MSQDMDLVVPLMIANFIAKVVADMLAKPLYKYQLDAKALPYLDPELEVTIDGHVWVQLVKYFGVLAWQGLSNKCPVCSFPT